MIAINLLPPELRKKKKKFEIDFSLNIMPEKFAPTQKEQYALIGLGVSLAIVVLGTIGFLGVASLRSSKLNRLNREWAEIEAEYNYVKDLESKKNNMIRRKNFVKALMSKRMLWAKKLYELNGLIPMHVWLEFLGLKEKTESTVMEVRQKDGQVTKQMVQTKTELF